MIRAPGCPGKKRHCSAVQTAADDNLCDRVCGHCPHAIAAMHHEPQGAQGRRRSMRASGGGGRGAQALAWAAVAVVSVLIVSSRKHYSVDVLIAWWAASRFRFLRAPDDSSQLGLFSSGKRRTLVGAEGGTGADVVKGAAPRRGLCPHPRRPLASPAQAWSATGAHHHSTLAVCPTGLGSDWGQTSALL